MTPGAAGLRVYLDEDMDVLLATLLAAHGWDCLPAGQAGNLGWSDEEQLEYATQERRVLVTHKKWGLALSLPVPVPIFATLAF